MKKKNTDNCCLDETLTVILRKGGRNYSKYIDKNNNLEEFLDICLMAYLQFIGAYSLDDGKGEKLKLNKKLYDKLKIDNQIKKWFEGK